jgi:hypothetical protein
MASRVVGIGSRKLTISGGDWILVKDRLNHGETQDAFARRYIANAFGGHSVNLRGQDMAKVTAYLLDWSLVGLDDKTVIPIKGQPVVDVEAALNSIDDESYDEIKAAIDAHEAAMATARAEEKKLSAGASASSATSLSAAPPA